MNLGVRGDDGSLDEHANMGFSYHEHFRLFVWPVTVLALTSRTFVERSTSRLDSIGRALASAQGERGRAWGRIIGFQCLLVGQRCRCYSQIQLSSSSLLLPLYLSSLSIALGFARVCWSYFSILLSSSAACSLVFCQATYKGRLRSRSPGLAESEILHFVTS